MSGMRKLATLCILSVLFCFTFLVSADAQVSLLYLHSQPGDFVGLGENIFIPPSQAIVFAEAFSVVTPGVADYAVFEIGDAVHVAFLEFGTEGLGTGLAPGFYPNADNDFTLGTEHPELDVGLDGRGDDSITGKFTITNAVFDYSRGKPRVVSFAATFEQHGNGAPPALFGTFEYNVPEPGPLAFLIGLGLSIAGFAFRDLGQEYRRYKSRLL